MHEDLRICFVGDSFVNGTGDDTALGWVGRVCADARTRGVRLTGYNLGVRRDTSQDVLARWEAECRRRLPDDCDRRIVLSFGVNDTVVEKGHQEAAALGIPQIDLFTPLVTNDAYRFEVARGDGAHPTAKGYAQIAACVLMSPAWWVG